MASVVACSSSNLLKAKYFRFEASFCFDSVSIFKIQAIKVSVLGKTQIIQLFRFLNNQVFAGLRTHFPDRISNIVMSNLSTSSHNPELTGCMGIYVLRSDPFETVKYVLLKSFVTPTVENNLS